MLTKCSKKRWEKVLKGNSFSVFVSYLLSSSWEIVF